MWSEIKEICNWLAMLDMTVLITLFGMFVILAGLKPDDDSNIEWDASPYKDY